jgi:hypothetical protein
MFQINRTLTAAANMLALVNSGSSYQFSGTEFTFGPASAQTPSNGAEQTNSQVTLTADEQTGFIGTKTVRYRRLSLGATRPGAAVSYTVGGADTPATLKAAIAAQHNLVESEFNLSGTWPTQGAGANTFTLTAVAGSLLYVGSITVQVTYPA